MTGIVLAQLVVGCASTNPHIPFSIPRDEFLRTARTIALAPLMGPEGIEVADSSLARTDELIEETLVGAGYHCISSAEYTAAWDRILAEMGGLYDSITGEVDELRLDVASEQLRMDLHDIFRTDYLLYPEIWIVQAASSGGVANWDGTSQPIVGFGTRLLNAIDAILNQYEGFLQPEVVNALSLGVVVENMDGEEIFQHVGGIEVLKVDDESETPVPVLMAPERIQNAVRAALLPFLTERENSSAAR